MDSPELTRRKVLAGLAVGGSTGLLVGGGTGALFSDQETFANNAITASKSISGVVDLKVSVDSLPGQGLQYTVTLPEGVNNNPAYIWIRTKQCPRPGDLAVDVEITLSTKCENGSQDTPTPTETETETATETETETATETETETETETATPGTETNIFEDEELLSALNKLREGRLLCSDAACLQPGDSQRLILDVTDIDDDFEKDDGPLSFQLEFYGQQCRYVPEAENPFGDPIAKCDLDTTPTPTPSAKAISFIAFCSESGGTLNPKITEELEDDTDDDPTKVEWETDDDVDYVVVKSGENFTIYDYSESNVTGGTAETGGDPEADFYGTKSNSNSSEPCELAADMVGDGTFPDSGTSVKLEYCGSGFQKGECQ